MSQRQIDLEGGGSFDASAANDLMEVPQYTSSESNLSRHKLPRYLCRFAPPSLWETVHIDELVYETKRPKTKFLYLEEMLLKKHHPNAVFEQVQKVLRDDHCFAFKMITAENIKCRLRNRYPAAFISLYYPFHFFFRRVLPKMKGFRKVFRMLNLPLDMSKAEIMGRLIYKGFHIMALQETDDETIFVAKINPTQNPSKTKPQSSEGVLFRMSRVGKQAKKITVYKFRSMHPYAEYVQEYIHTMHGLDAGGKFKNDFRVSTGGRIIRKYWIDELPMFINLLKGDIKLIGVRPISEHYFSLYPPHLQELRVKNKPGLLPPFYADMPTSFEEIIQSELNYLTAYEKAPLKTDVSYFLKIVKNILLKKARSK